MRRPLRERLKDTRARDLMPYYTWDALIAGYMIGFERNIKAAIIARKIVDEFDPKDECIQHRMQLQMDIYDNVVLPPSDGLDEGGSWPEGLGIKISEPFEHEYNELCNESVCNVLGIPYEPASSE